MGFIFGHFVWHFVISIHREFPSIGAIFSQSMLESKNITLKSFENENKIIKQIISYKKESIIITSSHSVKFTNIADKEIILSD